MGQAKPACDAGADHSQPHRPTNQVKGDRAKVAIITPNFHEEDDCPRL